MSIVDDLSNEDKHHLQALQHILSDSSAPECECSDDALAPKMDRNWSDLGVDNNASAMFRTLDHLGALQQRPLFFREPAQFWAAFGILDTI